MNFLFSRAVGVNICFSSASIRKDVYPLLKIRKRPLARLKRGNRLLLPLTCFPPRQRRVGEKERLKKIPYPEVAFCRFQTGFLNAAFSILINYVYYILAFFQFVIFGLAAMCCTWNICKTTVSPARRGEAQDCSVAGFSGLNTTSFSPFRSICLA